jgi:hypothetical protein
MEKRKLRLEELVVESFETAAAGGQRGTVRANEDSGGWICSGTCYATCASCNGCGSETCYGHITCAGVDSCVDWTCAC